MVVAIGFFAGSAAWTAEIGLWGLVGRRGREGWWGLERKMDCVWWDWKMDLEERYELF